MTTVDMNLGAEPDDKLFNRTSLPQGVESEPAKLSPVQWDKLPKITPGTNRLATRAPGTDKGSGLVDLASLLGESEAEARAKAPAAPPPNPGRPRATSQPGLVMAAHAGGGSGLIELDAIRQAVANQEGEQIAADDAIANSVLPSFSASTLAGGAQVGLSSPEAVDVVDTSSSRMMLFGVVGLLAVVVGLLGYVASL
jgi:hypothetical protein